LIDSERVTIESLPAGERVILKVAGRMDADNAPLFESQCESWISQGIKQLVIDVGNLSYVSSMGLRAFVAIGKRLQDKGGKLRICCQTGLVKQVFEITRLNTIFPPHETVEAALADD
jgi:anti-sigma B factor antagonist